jgi:hypothetical protein
MFVKSFDKAEDYGAKFLVSEYFERKALMKLGITNQDLITMDSEHVSDLLAVNGAMNDWEAEQNEKANKKAKAKRR